MGCFMVVLTLFNTVMVLLGLFFWHPDHHYQIVTLREKVNAELFKIARDVKKLDERTKKR